MDKKTVVGSLTLSIKKGELFSLLGQNAAGKTTTIKMLCCLLKPTAEDVVLLGNSILTQTHEVKEKINVSPQETAIAPNLSVSENLIFMVGIYGSKKDIAKKEALEIMKILGLEAIAKDKAKILSGGMQRRLSIAMALITKLQILFLDEPTL